MLLQRQKIISPRRRRVKNSILQTFILEEKALFKPVEQSLVVKGRIPVGGEIFLLNTFLRQMRPNEDIQTILQKIYGLGVRRTLRFAITFNYFYQRLAFKNLTAAHYAIISGIVEAAAYCLQDNLRLLTKINIFHYKSVNCYRGIRHSLYLPVHGQRTHSNAHVARYRSSGTFEYVPRRPSAKLKKLSKFSRRKTFLVYQSNARYKRLVNKYFVEFTKTHKYLFKYLAKKK